LLSFESESLTVLAYSTAPFTQILTQELMALNSPGDNELHRSALAANALARVYAQVVEDLLKKTGVMRGQVIAIGAHGQTVRHQPQAFDGTGYTLQLNNPSLLAELVGIDVVADFRSRDVAAGGQGAPLVPAFHQALFGRFGSTVATLNIGGIANITILGPKLADDVLGFDCGPGNALMDAWCLKHLGHAFDAGGAWAASGHVYPELLAAFLGEPYFGQAAPKSTGRDLFNSNWLTTHLKKFSRVSPVDIQATLTELTARSCSDSVSSYAIDSKLLIVCGGGAFNTHLMQRLQALLPWLEVCASQSQGLPALQVEAAAFAWLARKTIHRETSSLQKVTGAKGARILGSIYPA
jgi:anhydro-N-acetylmuramic acid kinase